MENSKPQDKKGIKKIDPAPVPLKERLWNILGVLFYICVAIGTVYHLILGH